MNSQVPAACAPKQTGRTTRSRLISRSMIDRMCLAVEESLMDVCEVAFSRDGQREVMSRLKMEGYGEPDLVSVNVMCRHLYLHRKIIVDEVRDALCHLDDKPIGFLLTSSLKETSLRRAVDVFKSRSWIKRLRAQIDGDAISLDLQYLMSSEGGVYLLCVRLLSRVRGLLPEYAEIDDASLALYLLCLRVEIATEMARANIVSTDSLWG